VKAKALPSREYLMECFDYDPLSGLLTWKVRPLSHFVDTWRMNQSNSRNSGEVVSTVEPSGYIVMKINGSTYKAHRVIWKIVTGKDPIMIDHINGLRSDNRIENLRLATKHQNGAYSCVATNNTSGVSGVSYHNRDSKWQSYITVGGSRIHLGCFETLESAVSSRKDGEFKYFGEYRRK
jgi:hypothetical protein